MRAHKGIEGRMAVVLQLRLVSCGDVGRQTSGYEYPNVTSHAALGNHLPVEEPSNPSPVRALVEERVLHPVMNGGSYGVVCEHSGVSITAYSSHG